MMIAVVPYREEHDVIDKYGRVIRPKGIYVDYGVNVETLECVCLPPEEFNSFVSCHCYFSEEHDAYILKN